MRNSISKTIVAGLAALAMAAAVILPTTPASAGGFRMGRRRLAWRRLGRRLARRRLGWRLARRRLARRLGGGWPAAVWHPGYWRGGVWYNGWWGPAIAAGVAGRAPSPPIPIGAAAMAMGTANRRLLGVSPDLRRLRPLSRPKLGEHLLDQRGSARLSRASRKRGPFRLGAGQNTPPVIGVGTPVVVGKESGMPRRERKAR